MGGCTESPKKDNNARCSECEILITGGNLEDQEAAGDCWKSFVFWEGEGLINFRAVSEDRPVTACELECG